MVFPFNEYDYRRKMMLSYPLVLFCHRWEIFTEHLWTLKHISLSFWGLKYSAFITCDWRYPVWLWISEDKLLRQRHIGKCYRKVSRNELIRLLLPGAQCLSVLRLSLLLCNYASPRLFLGLLLSDSWMSLFIWISIHYLLNTTWLILCLGFTFIQIVHN